MLLLILISLAALTAVFMIAPARFFAALSLAFCLAVFGLRFLRTGQLLSAGSIPPVIALAGFLVLAAAFIWLLWVARRARRNKISDL